MSPGDLNLTGTRFDPALADSPQASSWEALRDGRPTTVETLFDRERILDLHSQREYTTCYVIRLAKAPPLTPALALMRLVLLERALALGTIPGETIRKAGADLRRQILSFGQAPLQRLGAEPDSVLLRVGRLEQTGSR